MWYNLGMHPLLLLLCGFDLARATTPADVALIVDVESYRSLPRAEYAHRDGDAAWLFATTHLGVPAAQVYRLRDPLVDQLLPAVERAAAAVPDGGRLWVFWSGHGAASPHDGEHLLLAADATREPRSLDRASLSLSALRDAVARSGASQILLVLDVAFTGFDRRGAPLIPDTGFYGSPPALPSDPRIITLLGAGPDAVASVHGPQRLGTFTWLVLGAMRGWADGASGRPDGQVTLGEVQRYLHTSFDALGRASQDPRALYRPSLSATVIGPASREQRPVHADLDRFNDAPFPQLDRADVADEGGSGFSTTTYAWDLDESDGQAPLTFDPTALQEQVAEVRPQVQAAADAAWADLQLRLRPGDPEGARLIQAFLDRFDARTYVLPAGDAVITAEQAAAARGMLRAWGQPLPPRVDTVRIEPDDVLLGTPYGSPAFQPESTLHRARVTRPFLLGATEVTERLWVEVMGRHPGTERHPDRPVSLVTWVDAATFCNRLSQLDGLQPAYQITGRQVTWDPAADGWRLPTEAEWTLAAASGPAHDPDQPELSCAFSNLGGSPDDLTCDDGSEGLSDVGRYEPDALGLFDLVGNAAEWVWDAWTPFDARDVLDPAPAAPVTRRVIKGGSYLTPPEASHPGAREAGDRLLTRPDLGLRVARNAP